MDNAVFPTPWKYEMELHTDNSRDSYVEIIDKTGYTIFTYSGDCDGAHQFIESAYVMEESHALLDACKMLLTVLQRDCDADAFGSEISHAEGVIASAERA